MHKQCGHAHGSQSYSEPRHHRISLPVEGLVGDEVIFSIPQSLSASNKIPVNLIMITSVMVVVTGNGDRDRQREVRQHKSPFFNS